MENTLKDLLELALSYKALSLEVNDWSCQEYRGEKDCYVRCYFSDTRDYFSIVFEDNSVNNFGISFFDSPTFSFGSQLATNKALKNLLIKYRIFYNKLKKQLKAKTRKEREQEKLQKIKLLEDQLKNLKNKK